MNLFLELFGCVSFHESLQTDLGMRLPALLDSLNHIMQLVFRVIRIKFIGIKFMALNESQVHSHVALYEVSLVFLYESGCEH